MPTPMALHHQPQIEVLLKDPYLVQWYGARKTIYISHDSLFPSKFPQGWWILSDTVND